MSYKQPKGEERSVLTGLRTVGLNKAELGGNSAATTIHQARAEAQRGALEWRISIERINGRTLGASEQVSAHLRRTRELAISPETIYRCRDLQAGGTIVARVSLFGGRPGQKA